MKKIEIGKKEYLLCETANDLNARRYKELKDYLLMIESGVDVPTISKHALSVKTAINQNDIYSVVVGFHNFLTGLEMVKAKKDPFHYIFALIVSKPDEDQSVFSESLADDKLKEMYSEGLTQGYIEEVVNSFLKGSSTRFVTDFVVILESLKTGQLS